jgi:ESS family glutamate:Na+ symporter
MVTAAVAILSFTAIARYWLPTAVLGISGGFLTIWWCTWIGRKVFLRYPLENLAAQYGMLTGTISNGMALLREVDPDFSSDAADNLVLGSGTGLAAGLPLLIAINIPVQGYLNDQANGTDLAWMYYLGTLAILAIYLVVLTLLAIRRRKRPAKAGA